MSAVPFLLGNDDGTGVSLFDSLRHPDLSAFGYDSTQDWSFLSQPKQPVLKHQPSLLTVSSPSPPSSASSSDVFAFNVSPRTSNDTAEMTGTFSQWPTDAIAPVVEVISASDIVAPATDAAGPSNAYSFPARSKSVGVAAFPGDQQQGSVLYQLCPPPSTSHGYPQRRESFATLEQYPVEVATAQRRHSVYEPAEAASLFFEPTTSAPLSSDVSAFGILPAMVPMLDMSAVDAMQLGVPVDFADNIVPAMPAAMQFANGFDTSFGARERAATTSLLAPQPVSQQLRSRSETSSGVLSASAGMPFTPEPAFLMENGAVPSVLMRHMSVPDAGTSSYGCIASPVASSSRSPMSPPMPTFAPTSYRPQTAPAYAAPPTEWCSDYPTGSFGVMRVSNMGYTSQVPLERASHPASVLAPEQSCDGMPMSYAQQHAHKHLNFAFHPYSMPSGSPFDGSEQLFAPNGRILLACAFCKARKLRCDGAGPKCSQCKKRGMECQYPTTVRRRGKAKKTKLREAQEAAAKLQAEQQAAQGLPPTTTASRKRSRSNDEPVARPTLDDESGSDSDGDELPPRRASMACVQGVNLLEAASQSRKRRRTDSV